MRLDLSGVGIVLQPEGLDERATHLRPVRLRSSGEVGVEVAHGAVPLPQDCNTCPAVLCASQSCNEVGDFLPQGRWARRLPVRACEHCSVGVALRHLAEIGNACLERRKQDAPCGLKNARVAQVVDVFGCASEMHQLECCLGCARVSQTTTDVVLHGLHVVIDTLFDLLHGLRCIHCWLERHLFGATSHCGG